MTEDARDKAVEEALNHLHRSGGSGVDDLTTLGTLWQRAQEAEREENCKAVCDQCAQGVPLTEDVEHHYECQGGPSCGESVGPHGYVLSCPAAPIRNRAACGVIWLALAALRFLRAPESVVERTEGR